MNRELSLIIAWVSAIVFELIIMLLVNDVIWKTAFMLLFILSVMFTYELWEDFKNDD